METQAAGLRRRRLLGDLPLLPLATVVDRLLPPTLHSRQRKAGVLFLRRVRPSGSETKMADRCKFRTCSLARDRDAAMLLVEGRKTSGLHTLHCQNVLESTTATGNREQGKKIHTFRPHFLLVCGSQSLLWWETVTIIGVHQSREGSIPHIRRPISAPKNRILDLPH
jgi:hypothetical protein